MNKSTIMQDELLKMFFFGLMYAIEFGIMYLYGRRNYPRLAPILAAGIFILLMLVSFYNGSAGATLSLVAIIILLVIFSRPGVL